jgi:hypothetical protein
VPKLLTFAAGGIISAFLLAGTAGGTLLSPSGDTCTASGSNTTYTLHITIPGGAPQYGFAFVTPGTTVRSAVIPGTNGNFSAQNVSPPAAGAWLSDSPLSGAPVATLTTSGPTTGAITIIPKSSQSSSFDPVACALSAATRPMSIAFTVDRHVTYDGTGERWTMVVTIPEPGTVSATQLEPTTGTGAATPVTAKPQVESRRVVTNSAGKVTLTLQPTASGLTDLKARASIKVKLEISYQSREGRSADKLLSLTLER